MSDLGHAEEKLFDLRRENERLKAENQKFKALLKRAPIEDYDVCGGTFYRCSDCNAAEYQVHSPNCIRGKAIADIRAALEGE